MLKKYIQKQVEKIVYDVVRDQVQEQTTGYYDTIDERVEKLMREKVSDVMCSTLYDKKIEFRAELNSILADKNIYEELARNLNAMQVKKD